MSISYNSSREEVREAVRQNGNLLQNAHADLRKDRQIVVPTGPRAASSTHCVKDVIASLILHLDLFPVTMGVCCSCNWIWIHADYP